MARHFAAYLELFADEAAELSARLAKRMALIITAFLSASFALAIGCVWILNAVWDTQWRLFGIVGLFAVFTAGAIVAVIIALRRPVNQSAFHRLQSEWNQDQQLILEFMESQDSTKSQQSESQQYKTETLQAVES